MKTLNIWLEDEEYNALKEIKGNLSWHDFILQLTRKEIYSRLDELFEKLEGNHEGV